MLVGGAIARIGGATGVLVPVIAGAAGLLGGFNRPLAGITTRFIIFVVIAIGVGNSSPLTMAIIFILGAIWTGGLSLGLQPLFEFCRARPKRPEPQSSAAARRPTLWAEFKHWQRSLSHWPAWQYPVRITSCLVVAEAIWWVLPTHHTYWVALTVTIVVRHRISDSLVRAFERAIGTIGGVGLAMLLFPWSPSPPAIIAMIAVLAALRPVLRNANYTAYAMTMTPLVMLLLDLGQPPSLAVMLDRLFATIIGCILSLTLGYLVWPQAHASNQNAAGSA